MRKRLTSLSSWGCMLFTLLIPQLLTAGNFSSKWIRQFQNAVHREVKDALQMGSLRGTAYLDCDNNGRPDPVFRGLANVTVTLEGTASEGGPVSLEVISNANGVFSFPIVPNGLYELTFQAPAGFSLSTSSSAITLSDANPDRQLDAGFHDDQGPVFTNPPANASVVCGDPIIYLPENPTATDNSGLPVDIHYIDVVASNAGLCQIERTWIATDFCGNATDYVQIITTRDFTPPIIILAADTLYGTCDSIPNSRIKIIDECDRQVHVDYEEERSGTCPTVLTRYWEATDFCGNVSTASQVVILEDHSAPEIVFVHPDLVGLTEGDTVHIECDTIMPYGMEDAIGVDACDPNPSIEFIDYIDKVGDCQRDGFIWRMVCTWIATDACGNSDSVTLIMLVEDTRPPILSGVPADVSVTCGNVPEPAAPTAFDNCDKEVTITFTEIPAEDICSDYVIVRRWTAADDCDNQSTAEQHIYVEVDELQVGSVPADLTLSCEDAIPEPQDPTVSDGCYETDLDFNETIEGDLCDDHQIIRTWTISNSCGVVMTRQQVITILVPDLVFANVPGDVTIECYDEIPESANPTVNTTCFDPVVILEEGLEGDPCETHQILRVWTADDQCGRRIQATQTITVIVPELELSGIPADVTIQCDETLPDAANPSVNTSCFDPQIDLEETLEGDPCQTHQVIRTWTATDGCGRRAVGTQVITVVVPDLEFTSELQAVNLKCGDALPEVDTPSISTYCFDPELSMEEFYLGDTCETYKILRIWTALDACGRKDTLLQTITVDVPTLRFTENPEDLVLECTDEIPAAETPALSTDCRNPEVELDEYFLGDTCRTHKIIRIWTARDICGHQDTAVQTITVIVPPMEWLSVPEDMTISCDEPLPTDEPVADESCFSVTLEVEENTIPGECPQEYTLIRTWTATNSCGDQITATKVITVVDETAPEITPTHPSLDGVPSGDTIWVSCDNLPNILETDVEVSDNCGDVTVEFFEEQVASGSCLREGYLAKMVCGWTATDACGNSSTYVFTVIVIDNQAPELSEEPADMMVDLFNDGPVPAAPDITAIDNCDGHPVVTFEEEYEAIDEFCGYLIIRTWTAEDKCGNVSSHVQRITVKDICDCPNILITDIQIQNPGCGRSEGSFRITPSGHPSNYEYTLIPDFGNANAWGNERSNLPEGVYLMLVSIPDLEDCIEKIYFEIRPQGCTDTVQVDIPNAATTVCLDQEIWDLEGELVSASFCNSGNPETVMGSNLEDNCLLLTPANGFIGLSPDMICVVHCFDNQASCDTTYIRVRVVPQITECRLAVSASDIVDPDCAGNLGRISLETTGGQGALSYTWSPAVSTGAIAENLEAGTYQVTVMDAANCSSYITINLVLPEAPAIIPLDIAVADADCGIANGSISSKNNLVYTVVQGESTLGSTPIDSLAAGEYTLIYQEGSCVSTMDITIGSNTDWDIRAAATPETCVLSNGTLSISVEGATGPFTYQWSEEGLTGSLATGLSADKGYSVTVSDEAGCSAVLRDMTVPRECETDCSQPLFAAGQNTLQIPHCDSLALVCINSSFDGALAWDFFLDGQPYEGGLAPCPENANGAALMIPAGTHRIIAVNPATNCRDSIQVQVLCGDQPVTDILRDTLFVGEDKNLCLDASELPQELAGLQILCENGVCNHIDVSPIPDNCVRITGVAPGQDTIIVILCDETAVCDTTILILTVLPDDSNENNLPNAVVDVDTLQQNGNLNIDLLSNDQINGSLLQFNIVQQPLVGSATINLDNSVTYVPPQTYCGVDAFTYEICNENGCDTAFVYLLIKCSEPVPYTGFSPNNDRVNDNFFVQGIEQFPDNELVIFDRWGVEVYRVKGYRNDWNGIWNGRELPDGTYFYMLYYGEGKRLSGYVQLNR